jgi:acyl carrier protein
LCIGGAGLARGYLASPDTTAEAFVPNPFSSNPGERLYKTGDLVRHLPDGNIEFLRRLDSQIKIRGFRVEAGEIETVLRQHPAVDDAVVMVREDVPGDKQLSAYIVSDQPAARVIGELRDFLKKKLPNYMLPYAFVFLDRLPLTANGKIDRSSLPVPDPTRPDLKDTFVAPRTQLEKQIVAIWAEILKLERVGIHDDFFDLGGHSLLAIRVISRVREAFQTEVPLRSLFEMSTVAGLASVINKAKDEGTASPVPKISSVSRQQHRVKLSSRSSGSGSDV